MAKLSGNIKFRGTLGIICIYQMYGRSFLRMKSSLTGTRVKKSPEFRLTMVYARLMGRASRIGSEIYRGLPKEFREHWMYRAFTGEALQSLKVGMTDKEVKAALWKTYVEVWEIKAAQQLQEQGNDIAAKRKLSVQNPVSSPGNRHYKIDSGPINSLFLIPRKESNRKIIQPDAGRRILRRRTFSTIKYYK